MDKRDKRIKTPEVKLKDRLKIVEKSAAPYSVSKAFVSRRKAAGSAVARPGEATTTRMI
jgi:hypothetical protein